MSSLWNRSGIVERYADDLRASGAKAFFYQGGTTSLLTVFQDSSENAAHSSPVVADANGRWPDVFIPYVVSFDVQVKSADDVQLTYSLQIPNPDPVDLSVIIPPEERIQTGMIVPEMVNTTRPGFVRLNGRTIGNPASLASERANVDTSALFQYLWNNISNTLAPVSSGRGASASADFAANKNIVLPDWRGYSPIGLDDMGNTAAGAFSGLLFNSGSGIVAGSSIGANAVTLASDQMPSHSHTGTTSSDSHTHSGTTDSGGVAHTHGISGSGTTSGSSVGHSHIYAQGTGNTTTVSSGSGANVIASITLSDASTGGASADHSHTWSFSGTSSAASAINHTHAFSIESSGAHTHTFTTSTVGGTVAINNIPLSRIVTWFIKL